MRFPWRVADVSLEDYTIRIDKGIDLLDIENRFLPIERRKARPLFRKVLDALK